MTGILTYGFCFPRDPLNSSFVLKGDKRDDADYKSVFVAWHMFAFCWWLTLEVLAEHDSLACMLLGHQTSGAGTKFNFASEVTVEIGI